MFTPIKSRNAKPGVPVVKSSPPHNTTTLRAARPSHHQISLRAYELYDRGGRKDGKDQQDWLNAERELLVARQ